MGDTETLGSKILRIRVLIDYFKELEKWVWISLTGFSNIKIFLQRWKVVAMHAYMAARLLLHIFSEKLHDLHDRSLKSTISFGRLDPASEGTFRTLIVWCS